MVPSILTLYDLVRIPYMRIDPSSYIYLSRGRPISFQRSWARHSSRVYVLYILYVEDSPQAPIPRIWAELAKLLHGVSFFFVLLFNFCFYFWFVPESFEFHFSFPYSNRMSDVWLTIRIVYSLPMYQRYNNFTSRDPSGNTPYPMNCSEWPENILDVWKISISGLKRAGRTVVKFFLRKQRLGSN